MVNIYNNNIFLFDENKILNICVMFLQKKVLGDPHNCRIGRPHIFKFKS